MRWIGLILLLFFFSCGPKIQDKKPINYDSLKEPLENVNRHLLETEEEEIQDYIRRYQWEMKKTRAGVYYMVYEAGVGPQPKKGDLIRLEYCLKLVNGETAYSSETDGPINFTVGSGQVETGLDDVVLYLNLQDKAKIIIPSHLGYGLVGDDNKIPRKATLIYDIHITDIQ